MRDPEGSSRSPTANSARAMRKAAAVERVEMNNLLVGAAFSAVFDSSMEALVVVNLAGALQMANPRARELLRVKATDIRQTTLGEFVSGALGENLKSFALFKDVQQTAQSIETNLVSGFPIRITLRSILPMSQDLLLCLEEGPIVQRAEARWRQVEAELRSVLDSVAAGVLLIDPQGRIRYSSARFGQLFGIDGRTLGKIAEFKDLEELLARRLGDPQTFSAPWKSFEAGAGEPRHDELEIAEPTRRLLERFSRPVLDAEGRPVGWLELLSDVTSQRQIQSKLLQSEKMAALGQLVSGIAHELNNPLTAIMGYAQLMLGHGLNPAQLSEASKVYHEAERARRIVKNLLYFARENRSEQVRVDVNEIVERTLALRSYELRVENIVIDLDLARDLPKTMADPYQLQQVVLNLVINAEQSLLEGRGQGHIRIRTEPPVSGRQAVWSQPNSSGGFGRWAWHRSGNRLAHFRSILHHQAVGPGYGSRTLNRFWHRPSAWRGSHS